MGDFGDDEEHQQLIEEVKNVQRTSPEHKSMWYSFCKAAPGPTAYDPRRHDSQFLKRFLEEAETGEIEPLEPSGYSAEPPRQRNLERFRPYGRNYGGAAASHPVEADEEPEMALEDLVEKVQTMKNFSPESQNVWHNYCSKFGKMSNDPADYDANFLRKFLKAAGPFMKNQERKYGAGGANAGEGHFAEGESIKPWTKGGKGSGGGPVKVTEKIFVGGIPKETTEEELKIWFEQFGEVKSVTFKHDETGQFRGFGFVEFETVESAEAVLENYEFNMFEEKWLECKAADPNSMPKGMLKGDKGKSKGFSPFKGGWSAFGDWDGVGSKGGKMGKYGGSANPASFGMGGKGFSSDTVAAPLNEKLFIGALPKNVTEERVEQHFSQFGTVVKVELKYDKGGGCRGFGFVTFDSLDAPKYLIQNYANNVFDEGSWIDIKAAMPLDENKGSKGFDGGKGGKGGYSGFEGYGKASFGMTNGDGFKGKGGKTKDKSKRKGSDEPWIEDAPKIYVGGLPEFATEALLWTHFGKFGLVKEVTLKYDDAGVFRGFGFVEFDTADTMKGMLNNQEHNVLEGYWLDTKPAWQYEKDEAKGKSGKGAYYAEIHKLGDRRPKPGIAEPTNTVLRVVGINYDPMAKELMKLFREFSITRVRQSNLPGSDAFVMFSAPDECKRAFSNKQGTPIRNTYIELWDSSPQELDMVALDPELRASQERQAFGRDRKRNRDRSDRY